MNKSLIVCLIFLFSVSCLTKSDRENSKKFERVIKLFEENKYEQTILILDSLLEKHPTNHVVLHFKGKSLFNLGYEKEGIELLDKAISIDNTYYFAYRDRAIMKSLQPDADFENTDADFIIALNEFPTDTTLALMRASFADKKDLLKEAKKFYEYVVKIDSTNYFAQVGLASILGRLGNNIAALNRLNKIIHSFDSIHSIAIAERAYIYIRLENYDSAIVDYKVVLESNLLDPSPIFKAYTYNNLGYAQCMNGQVSEGLENINKSLELEPSNSYAYRNLGEILIIEGKLKEGCNNLRKAQELGFKEQYGDEVEKLINQYCEQGK